jgi:hypothetical protein
MRERGTGVYWDRRYNSWFARGPGRVFLGRGTRAEAEKLLKEYRQ